MTKIFQLKNNLLNFADELRYFSQKTYYHLVYKNNETTIRFLNQKIHCHFIYIYIYENNVLH